MRTKSDPVAAEANHLNHAIGVMPAVRLPSPSALTGAAGKATLVESDQTFVVRFSEPLMDQRPAPDTSDMSAMAETAALGEHEDLEMIRDGARLAALRDLSLLDATEQESFDRLTRLATAALGVPVSLVSLVDADRQFFLSQQGLGDQWAQARQTPLSHSFCQHAVATRQPLVISDAREDPRVDGNLAIRDLGVIAYAGIPLILDDGHAVGAFCAIDSQPRDWTEAELAVLKDLAATVTELLDLRATVAREGLYDRLTGLPNRSLLVAHAEQHLQRRGGSGRLVVMCVGLDDFTQINQALGTDQADAVLTAAGSGWPRRYAPPTC